MVDVLPVCLPAGTVLLRRVCIAETVAHHFIGVPMAVICVSYLFFFLFGPSNMYPTAHVRPPCCDASAAASRVVMASSDKPYR